MQNSPTLRDDVTVEACIELLFRQATRSDGALDESPLTYLIKEGLLAITTRTVAEQTMDVRTYDLRPLNSDAVISVAGDMATTIQTMTGPESRTDAGGPDVLVQGARSLTIRQSPLIHRKIEELLEQFLHVAEQTGEPSD